MHDLDRTSEGGGEVSIRRELSGKTERNRTRGGGRVGNVGNGELH